MIFVCTGSREYQFNRLLREIDRLIEDGKIEEEVVAQIGGSSYIPKNYKYKRFMNEVDFEKCQDKADIIISHGGTGAIIGALKKRKQLIAVPRLSKYGEHIDDHQTQIVSVLADQGLLVEVLRIRALGSAIKRIKESPITKVYNKESNVFNLVNQYIEQRSSEKKKKGLTPLTKSLILTPLNILYSISPRLTLRVLYRLKQGRKLDLEDPKTYTEKLQWIKLFYKNPLMPKLVDKYTVRRYVEERCPEILNGLIWQGFDPKKIPWDKLPEKCVIKVTHGSGLNIICKNTKLIDRNKTEKILRKWLDYKFIKCYGEWFYGVERPRIIIEEYLDNETGEPPEDYKVMCFSGNPEYIIVDTDRFVGHKRNIYTSDWKFLKKVKMDFPNDKPIEPPAKEITKKLLYYAKELSRDFPHARIDLYIVKNKIYFGEITFTNGAGFDTVTPYEFDLEMGNKMKLPER